MNPAQPIWREVFMNWPTGLPRRGVVITTLNEATPFKSFFIRGEMLLLERTNPDPMGTRFVYLSYDVIHAIKFIEPLKESTLTTAGFVGKLATV